mgnify:FL=1|tara:strand:- start:3650 stop:7162 length:3513 start_codon:yes stop_codon:yes gene_type:complete
MAGQRAFFNKSISELEDFFQSHKEDQIHLNSLLHELNFRSTQRALALKERAQAASATLRKINDGPKTNAGGDINPSPTQPSSPPQDITSVSETVGSRLKPSLSPPVTNTPENILRAWTALEVLSPQSFRRETDLAAGEKSRIARFDNEPLPWTTGEKSRPNKRLYYELILGVLAVNPAVEGLLKIYSDNRPEMPSMSGYSPIATVLLDKVGRPLEDEMSFAISSFAWGVPVAAQGDLKKLADWPNQEKALMASFRRLLVRRDHNEEIIALTKERITELYANLVSSLGLEKQEKRAPYFALRRFEFFASKTPPEPSLLNSFYLEDLSIARNLAKDGKLTHALKYYLGERKPLSPIDLLANQAGLQDLQQPALAPLGRWPGKGRFPLALLQQAAVNATGAPLLETGILSVNGPPGTGKTTLLRDIVAARVVERAEVMAEFPQPAQAFLPTEQILQRNGAKITLHRLDNRLKGFEMVVASSNNKAVENVSAELPSLDAIASDAIGLRYFDSISNNVLGRNTWGVIAAVLGNSTNRFQFSQNFWRDEENGLSTYLNHASGIPQFVSVPQESGIPLKRIRGVVEREQPPANSKEALTRWQEARAQFSEILMKSKRHRESLQTVHELIMALKDITGEIDRATALLPKFDTEAQTLIDALSSARKIAQYTEENLGDEIEEKRRHITERPGIFARLFWTKRFQDWRFVRQQFASKVEQGKIHLADQRNILDRLDVRLTEKFDAIERTKRQIENSEKERLQTKTLLRSLSERLMVSIPDESFFKKTHEEIQTANVWFDDAANQTRDEVFEAAIKLHRAFIDGAADPLRQNLSVFVESFGTRSLGTLQKDGLIADLWASFFLVVPVVSTTFASVHRMFSRLDPETLGWLLVDEAGQATPQSAIGAMIRTKRSVVVGDPLQIEPVVTLPSSLTEEICSFFGVSSLKYNAPEASVQTVADAASPYCARFPTGSGHRDVGAPLLVHRRCSSPMFDISNEIAYSNLMVQAKKSLPESLPLGPSAWIDVVGEPGPDKWCADEASVLIEMLNELRASENDADCYIVTPFVVVQDNLRQILARDGVLDGWVDNPNMWVREHVGTVHTVQGREAGIIFFVLGAQAASQNGARGWAGGRPNLVNVAVTRAKTALYVIGNRQLWRSAGVFSVVDRYLPSSSWTNRKSTLT